MKQKKLHPAWIVFIGCTVMALTVIGLCNNTRTLYLEPVSAGLGVTRTALSVVLMISGLLSALCSMFMGLLRKKFSLRQMAIIGCAAMTAANLIYAVSTHLWTYLVGEILCGLGLGFASMTVLALLLRAWFSKYYGTLQGCVSMATGLGSIVFAPMLGILISEMGYRTAYLVSAGAMFLTLLITLLCIRESPEKEGLKPMFAEAAEAAEPGTAAETEGLTFREARNMPQFYLMCVLGFLLGSAIMEVQGTYGAFIGTDLGFGTVFAASVVSFLYIFNMIFKVPLGILVDKIGVRVVVIVCSTAMICASVALVLLGGGGGSTLAYVFGSFWGIGNIMFTVPAPLVAPTIFGTKDVTTITGIFMACFSLGSAMGSPIANMIYQNAGSYIPMYIIAAVQGAVSIVIAFIVIRPAWK